MADDGSVSFVYNKEREFWGNDMLIVFEGIDGSGKTTISNLVYTKLKSKITQIKYYKKASPDFDHPYVRKQMLKLKEVIWPPDLPIYNVFGDHYWLFLNAAWFSVIQRGRIENAKSQNNLIIFDGWYYRLIARFVNKGFDRSWLLSLFATVNEPNLVVLLDIKPQIAWKRRAKFKPNEIGSWDGFSGNSFDSYCMYQEQTRKELLRFAQEKSWFIINQTENTSIDKMCSLIYEYILSKCKL